MKRILDRVDIIGNDVGVLKIDVAVLKTDVATLKTDVSALKTDVATVKTDMGIVSGRLSAVEPKVGILWNQHAANRNSPRTLNAEGRRIFEQSNIKEIIDANIELLSKALVDTHPQNAYQLEHSTEEAMKTLLTIPGMLLKLQDRAYEAGVYVDELFLVGGLYLRDILLPKYDFRSLEINSGKPLSSKENI